MKKVLLRFFIASVAFLMSLLVITWLIWMPSPREAGYVFVSDWGEKGSGPGQFNDPTGIAVTKTEVFVSDSRNGRIQVFDFDGRFKRAFQGADYASGALGRPMNLVVHNDELFVADYWNDRIHVFGLDGQSHRTIGKTGHTLGAFNAPGGVAVADNGDLFVADFYNQRVQHLSSIGDFIEQWGTTEKVGIWAGEMNYPTDVALARDGSIFVADGYNDRVQVFSNSGTFLRKWGGPLGLNISGSFNGWFTTVSSIDLDPQGNVYTADFYNHRIQKFAVDGTFLSAFGTQGDGPGQFERVVAVAVANDGTVFVADYGNNRIQKWRRPLQ